MTAIEKERVNQMRRQGIGVTKIAGELGLSVNTVKGHLRRHAPTVFVSKSQAPEIGRCKQCGKPVDQQPQRKAKWFCSDVCRITWWNRHRTEGSGKSVQTVTCAYCGKHFDCYSKAHRKYCSHECYIKGRFGGEQSHDTGTV